jgi:uncharacterized protein YneF (UPF0154 family)
MDPDDELKIMVDNAYARLRQRLFGDLLLFGLMIVAAYVAGIAFLGWFIWKEFKLEKGFYDRYGQSWQEEYQKYYGSLAQAHLKIAICVAALMSIMAIGYWFYRQTRPRKSKRTRG